MLDIMIYPDPVLTTPAKPVADIDDATRHLLDTMADTMYTAGGIGLAAPQVGRSVQAIVVDASPRVEGETLIKLVNPLITFAEGHSVNEEGCLSLPGFSENVPRSASIVVEAYDECGKPGKIETDTFLAIVLQHEIDHLNGILFIDHLGRLKRDLIRRKLRKQSLREKRTRKHETGML
jgi:peptide deformylase